jgi:hypothetical protein
VIPVKTHLTYLRKLFGYLLLRAQAISGAAAPTKKKNTRATEKHAFREATVCIIRELTTGGKLDKIDCGHREVNTY